MTREIDLKLVNRSGFPFQLKVEHDLRATQDRHKWHVASREHAWTNSEGTEGFIDIVLKHIEHTTFRLVLECKRVKGDDARQLKWLFLVEDKKSDLVLKASSFQVEAAISARLWDDVQVFPASLESQFCVLPGDEPRRGLLERLANEVLEATEGLAQEEISLEKSIWDAGERHGKLRLLLFLFPMIVTNAKIAVCRFDPNLVSLEHGLLDPDDAEVFEVPIIRFRKSLATQFPEGLFYTLEAANRARERTVLVVNSDHLAEVLEVWKVDHMPDRDYAIKTLLQSAWDKQQGRQA